MKHLFHGTAALLLCLTLSGAAWGADTPKKGLLLVAFGTSMETGAPAYEGIEGAFRLKDQPVVWAFTSNIIRAKMARQGVRLLTVPEGLARLAEQGVTDVIVQSLHIMGGEEYAKMERLVLTEVLTHPDRFASVKVGRPLVESMRDAREVAEAVLHSLPAARAAGDAVLLMAHGQGEGRCDMVFAGMQGVVNETDPLAFMASVEGYQGIDQVLPQLQARGVRRVWLLPFMVVAGDHAHNDLAGDEPDSWASRLKAQGMEVFPVLKGLGENPGVQSVFVRHALETEDDYAHPVIKTSAAD
ncbi:MAG: sirohydrochlorin cobaltochelatase [Desulfovibrionaceae bacterium]|nr:sirohydrochlorin cobaltochelatase [Desulfovibrionaceae bacterium]